MRYHALDLLAWKHGSERNIGTLSVTTGVYAKPMGNSAAATASHSHTLNSFSAGGILFLQ